MANILWFNQISKNDVLLVGGKGASLGEMTNNGIPVPPGFVVTTELYKRFNGKEIPIEIEEEILKAFDNLDIERVAVRSSAVAEDSSTASWAGQLESYLNVARNNLIVKIKECWGSIQSEQVLNYAEKQGIKSDQLVVAVIVQKMVESESSGVIFTTNPITKNKNEIMIEAGYGLGEMLVQGMITPNNYLVDKDTLEITKIDVREQEIMLVFSEGENKEISVPDNKNNQQVLNEEQIKELTQLGMKIEKLYGTPQDIEWGLEKGKLYILQSRPITT